MAGSTFTAGKRRLSLLVINLSVFGAGVAWGSLMPLVALRLAHQGVSAGVIGLNTAMSPLAILAVGPFLPRLIARLGTLASICYGLFAAAITVLLLPAFPNLPAWFALRFFAGAAVSIQWVVSETWLNLVANERDRGRIMGIYATVMALGFAIGPCLIGLVGIEGWTPFLLIVLAMLLSASPLPLSRGLAPAMPAHQEVPLARLVRAQPLVMACAVLGGVADLALFSLLPVYGLRHGLDQSQALIAVSVFVGGNVVLQIPIGWIADHMSRRATLLSCILVTILGTLLLPAAVGHGFWLYVLVFFLGGSTFSTYTLGLGLLGDGFPLAQLAAANVAFVMAYQVGSAGGPILAGTAMDVFGPEGLAGVVVTSAVMLLALFFGLAPKR